MSANSMTIKVERVYIMQGDTPLKAFADISINEAILVKGIKVVDGKKGMFVSMPSDKGKDDKWYENVRCLDKEVREIISEEVMEAYKRECQKTDE